MSYQLPRLAGNTFHHVAQQRFAQTMTTTAFRCSQPTLKGPLPREPIMNRAKRGLFHGKHIMFGNHVAHSERKCRRTWLPNIQTHKYTSELLGKEMKLRLTTKAMKCIDKCGGFDNYILNTNLAYLGGENSLGSRLKNQITKAQQLEQQKAAYAAYEAKMKEVQASVLAKIKKKQEEKVIDVVAEQVAEPAAIA